jgi:hypothetical protein
MGTLTLRLVLASNRSRVSLGAWVASAIRRKDRPTMSTIALLERELAHILSILGFTLNIPSSKEGPPS